MKEQLIIVNHIGTSFVTAIDNELRPLVREIEESLGCETVLSFSSKGAINKLIGKDVEVKYFYDLIRQVSENYRLITVLPTHIVGGADYQSIYDSIETMSKELQLRTNLQKIKLLEPLLIRKGNIQRLAKAINNLIADKNQHIIFVGHGTINESNSNYTKFIQAYKEISKNVSFLSLNESVHSILHQTPQEVLIFPLFAVNGYHMHKDVFSGDASVVNQLQEAGKIVDSFKNGLLSYSNIRKIYLDSLIH